MQRGVFCVLSAFVLWGLFPVYFHAVRDINALEILGHRVVWCVLFVGLILWARHHTKWLRAIRKDKKTLWVFAATSLLIGANWGTYVYAITSGQALEASLGYFINPLVSVVLGAVVLKERLRLWQRVAFAFAFAGVAWITWQTGQTPWLGLALAVTFAAYGLLRKLAPLGSLEGMALETVMLTPLALGYLGFLWCNGTLAFTQVDTATQWLLVAAGPITAIPLLLFTAGVRLIPYTTVGILQYLSPSIVFLLGLFYLGEPFSLTRLIGFMLIWAGVGLFVGESFVHTKRRQKENPAR